MGLRESWRDCWQMEKPPDQVNFLEKYGSKRELGDWWTRYPIRVWIMIFMEALYLCGVIALAAFGIYKMSFAPEWTSARLSLSPARADRFAHYAVGYFAGLLGGCLFAMKWLYHAVANSEWHVDRIPWRVLTPPLSGFLAEAFVLLAASGLLSVFNGVQMQQSKLLVFSVGFLVGYFSDSAIGKLAEIAATVFGASKLHPTGVRVDEPRASANPPPARSPGSAEGQSESTA